MKCITICRIALALIGLVFIALGAGLGWGAFPGIIEDTVEENIDLTDSGSEGYKNFKTPPVPVYMKFTFFEVMNPQKFVTGEEKAKFKERGPYVYKEVREKRDYEYKDNFLEYSQYRHFEFQEDMSCKGCKKEDEVTILNMPLIGGVDAAMKQGFLGTFVLKALATKVDNVANSKDIVLTDTVDKILFAGVKNPLVEELMANTFTKTRLPPAIQKNGFAIFNTKNASTVNENYRVYTSPVERHSEINLWGMDRENMVANLSTTRTCPSILDEENPPACSRSENPVWWPYPDGEGEEEDTICNSIRGTNAEQFPPFLEDRKNDDLWIFTTDLCRSMPLRLSGEGDIDGIDILRYSVPEDSGNINKKNNICFCKDFSEIKSNEGCIKNSTVADEYDISECETPNCHDGLQNIENCQKSPVIMCSPHFYMAEEQLENFDASFQRPNPDNDKTYLEIEPVTGMTVTVHKRIQINMPIVPTGKDEIVFLKSIKQLAAFPVLWLDEGADIDQANIDKIKSMVTIPLLALDIAKYVMIGLGCLLVVIGAILCC
eukprot:TRINITY_DN5167_c0_g1_i1.p1 TRINITY_DN5167_c0_g1~~TRINITY_DN5167_c0_g1_i1.p1  ORF type:complete len:546 (+),score=146.03 TRINITY_DN5167_c0_g1_i1:28-1665(+)